MALIGPRQVGKTTLARQLAETRPSLYLDLESRTDRNKLSDPELLAGRIEYVDLSPLNVLEVKNTNKTTDRLWRRGGFPDSYLAKNDADSFHLRRNFVCTYLETDVPQFRPRIPAKTLERALGHAGAQSGHIAQCLASGFGTLGQRSDNQQLSPHCITV